MGALCRFTCRQATKKYAGLRHASRYLQPDSIIEVGADHAGIYSYKDLEMQQIFLDDFVQVVALCLQAQCRQHAFL
jgi:hypothetical protein